MEKVVYGLLDEDKMLHDTRVTVMQVVEEGGQEEHCCRCGTVKRFKKLEESKLVSMACSDACAHEAGYYTSKYPKRLVEDAAQKPQDDAKAAAAVTAAPAPVVEKVKRGPCSVCGGPVFKRGWKHADGCTMATGAKKVKVDRGPCPVCGGPACKRGWTHTPGCANSGAAKALARLKPAKTVAPETPVVETTVTVETSPEAVVSNVTPVAQTV